MNENFFRFVKSFPKIFLCFLLVILPIKCRDLNRELEEALQDELSGNTTRALLKYEIILKDYPNNPTANKRMGMILSKHPVSMGAGISYLEKAYQLTPEDFEIRKELFFLYLATENYSLAKKILNEYPIQNQETLYREWETVYQCELNLVKNPNQIGKILEQSTEIPPFWKNRCKEKLSNK